ncbi:hypothetical protein JCM10450v2_001416 [Rhodotorula kratochvilovae]
MPRSTTRKSALKAKRALHEAEDDDQEDEDYPTTDEALEDDDERYVQEKPKAKRPSRGGAVGRGGPKGSKGALKGILDLPLDVLAIVCSELDLPTVFHLSRLNRHFYAFLRNNSTLNYIWDRARETSGLPELTAPRMDSVQCANLFFGGFCQGFGKATTKVDYILRARYCKACSEEHIWDDRDDDDGFYPVGPDYCPYSEYEGSGRERNHYEYLIKDLRFFESMRGAFYDNPEALFTVEEDDEAFVEVGAYSKAEFFERCTAVRNARVEDGLDIIKWQQERLEEKEAERQAIRDRRREAIEERFVNLGWKPHHFDSVLWGTHSLVNVAKEFSDSAWKSVRKPLEAFLGELEANRDAQYIHDEATRRLATCTREYEELRRDKERLKTLGLYPLPMWSDFRALKPVSSLWAVESIENAYSEDVPTIDNNADAIASELASLKAVFREATFPTLVKVLKDVEVKHASITGAASSSSTSTALLRLLPQPDDADDEFTDEQRIDIFSRACSTLVCATCAFTDVFPRILAHQCKLDFYGTISNASFGPSMYKVEERMVEAVMLILDKAGLPADAHYTALDDLGPTLTCTCGSGASIAVPWHDMAAHLAGLIAYDRKHGEQLIVESKQAAYERVFQSHVAGTRWSTARGDDVEL